MQTETEAPMFPAKYSIEQIDPRSGVYQGIERQWLRWCEVRGNWIPIYVGREQRRAKQAESLLAQERQRAEQLAGRLRALGLDP